MSCQAYDLRLQDSYSRKETNIRLMARRKQQTVVLRTLVVLLHTHSDEFEWQPNESGALWVPGILAPEFPEPTSAPSDVFDRAFHHAELARSAEAFALRLSTR